MTTEQTAKAAGMDVSLWDMGAASLVSSEGCAGVTRDQLESFARLIREQAPQELVELRAQAALAFQAMHEANMVLQTLDPDEEDEGLRLMLLKEKLRTLVWAFFWLLRLPSAQHPDRLGG